MQQNTDHQFGRAPTPDELEDAVRRARAIRSEFFHFYVASARESLRQSWRRFRMSAGSHLQGTKRHTDAPIWTGRQPFSSMLPDASRWMQALRGRSL